MTEIDQLKNSIKDMTKDTNELKVDVKGIQKDIEFLKISTNELNETMKNFIEKADSKFAPMWTATAMKFVMCTVALAVIGAVLSLIIK